MNDAETLKYDKLYADIERGIEATREDIKRTKNDLDEARRVRRNRMQYDALAKVGTEFQMVTRHRFCDRPHYQLYKVSSSPVQFRVVPQGVVQLDMTNSFQFQVICKNPDRATTGKKLTDVETEIARLETEEQILDAKLETRKKQFYVLVHSIQQLQEMLDEDDDDVGGGGEVSKSNDAEAADSSQASEELATGMDVS